MTSKLSTKEPRTNIDSGTSHFVWYFLFIILSWFISPIGAKKSSERETKRLLAEKYDAERKLLIDGEMAVADSFDKAMTTLTAGALGLSLAFIKDIAKVPHHLEWLALAYGGFGTSLLAILVSFLAGQEAYREQRTNLEKFHAGQSNSKTEKKNGYRTLTIGLNYSSIALFILGVFCLALFVWLNLRPVATSTTNVATTTTTTTSATTTTTGITTTITIITTTNVLSPTTLLPTATPR